MKHSKVTVLLSVRNEEGYIGPSIKSILDQTFKNFDFWIIDDGSTDDTYKVIKSFDDSRIKSWRFEKNTGLTSRLNWLVPKIRTEYIARMDSHHLADRTRLEKQFKFMDQRPKLMALGSNFIRKLENGNFVFKSNFPTEYEVIKNKLIEKNVFRHSSMFFRREIYNLVGLYDPYFKIAQDYDFILRVAGKYPVQNLPDNLITEIYRQTNMTQRFRARSAWEALAAQANALTRYSYPPWQSVFLLRGLAFLSKSVIYQSGLLK